MVFNRFHSLIIGYNGTDKKNVCIQCNSYIFHFDPNKLIVHRLELSIADGSNYCFLNFMFILLRNGISYPFRCNLSCVDYLSTLTDRPTRSEAINHIHDVFWPSL